jgi:hypothetical protein
MNEANDERATRPILGMGGGRAAVFAGAVGALLPFAILATLGDPLVERWVAAHRASADGTLWGWIAMLGAPLTWLLAAIVGYGVASGMNWPNTARWSGMLAFAVLWAGLANIAIRGEAAGTATVGAVACTLCLWQPRAWPLWAALGFLAATGRMVTVGVPASLALLGLLFGAFGGVVIEYAWHAASGSSVPRRGAPLQS